ncbi:MAG: hypothetical protein ABI472_06525 [Ginsengibacter sp.]
MTLSGRPRQHQLIYVLAKAGEKNKAVDSWIMGSPGWTVSKDVLPPGKG